MDKKQQINKIKSKIKQKRELITETKKEIKSLQIQQATLHYGFGIGDTVKQQSNGKIWKVHEFDGFVFVGFHVTKKNRWSICPHAMIGDPGDFEIIASFSLPE